MDNNLENLYKTLNDKYLPNGSQDSEAGGKEMSEIFDTQNSEQAKSLFLKTLFKFVFSGIPTQEELKEKLEASNTHNTNVGQRTRCINYLSYVILANQFGKSVKDIYFDNGKYAVKKEVVVPSKYNWKSVIAGGIITLFGTSMFNLSEAPKTNNLINSGSNSAGIVRELTNSIYDNDFDQINPPAKKSSSGICHPQGGTYYYKTKNFTPYPSVDDCLASGGRLPLK